MREALDKFRRGQDGEQCSWYPMGALRVSSLRVAAVARRPRCAGDDEEGDDDDEAEEQEEIGSSPTKTPISSNSRSRRSVSARVVF